MTIERLSAGDRLMLLAGDVWPQEIGALAILDGRGLWDADGRVRLDELRRRLDGRLHRVPRLRQVILRPAGGRGGPLWIDAPRFDVSEHVQTMAMDAPGGELELLACVEGLRRRRLDPSRPGWAMWFLTGLPGQRVGLFVKLHHAMADGMAAMTIIAALMDDTADVPDAPAAAWRPSRRPRDSELVADAIRDHLRRAAGAFATLVRPRSTLGRLRAAMPAARELLAEEPPPLTSLDGVVGQDRRLAVVRCPLPELRRIARAHDATVNDVLLAVTAAGLRALLSGRGEAVDGVWVPIYVPITMRRRWRGPVSGNRVAQMAIPLPLAVADPFERLRRIAAATAERKTRDRSAVGTLFRSPLATRLMLAAVDGQRVNVCSANIPGPRTPLSLAGSQVLDVVPILPLIGRVSLGVGAISYAGGFTLGVTADRDRFPDLDALVAGMKSELTLLTQTARPEAAPLSAGSDEPIDLDRAFQSLHLTRTL